MRPIFLLFGVAAFSSSVAAEELATAVDRMLAKTLLDPTSVIDYRVSGRVGCERALAEIKYDASDCVCYSLNAKNGFGAYSGRRAYAAQFVTAEGAVRLMPPIEITDQAGLAACEAASLTPRPADRISRNVSR